MTKGVVQSIDAGYRGDFDAVNRSEWAQATGLELDFLPWDIGESQSALDELGRSGQIHSEVLDIGCGLGYNALFLAERGYQVLGLDLAPTAIERAQTRAQEQGLDVEFVIADATMFKGYDRRFATAIDIGLYHGLTAQQRTAYLTAVHHACQPTALLHMVCISNEIPLKFLASSGVNETNLRDSLTSAAGWAVRGLERTTLTTAFTRRYIEQQTGSAGREAFDSARLVYDQQGRLLVPAWMATAERL